MKVKKIRLQEIEAPLIPLALSAEEVVMRHSVLKARMRERGLSHVIVYGDREHFANISYLTGGYDSRFEESLLIISGDGEVSLITGNEGYDYSNISVIPLEKKLFQTFSLQGQVRNRKRFLREVLKECGISQSSKIGIIGMKYYEEGEAETPDRTYDIPYYIVDELSHVVPLDSLLNTTAIMNHPTEGIRSTLSAREVARIEVMGSYLTNQMKAIMESLVTGMTEADAISHFDYRGVPFNVHPVVNFGTERVLLGLASPSFVTRLQLGDPVSIGLSVEGTSIARTGLAVRSGDDFMGPREDIIDAFYIPYFKAVQSWYETVKVGASSKLVFDRVMSILGDRKFGVGLNPGHQVAHEEWINSPFREDREYHLVSGMAFQCDIIAFPGEPYIGVHVEDTVVLADDALRKAVMQTFPDVWERIMTRKETMRNTLGIHLDDSLLPISNIQAVFHPFLLDTSFAFCDE